VSGWDEFFSDTAHEAHGPASKRRRVSRENPRSTVATDPYVNLEQDLETYFRVTDHDGRVFGYPDVYEIHEITHNVREGRLYGFGYKIRQDGTPGLKPCSEAILIAWSDIPAHLHERLKP
jgi:hypothetical protein